MRQASDTTNARPAPTSIAAAPDGRQGHQARPARPKRRADVKLLQSHQRPAQANPCANRVVTTRRQPVVTTRKQPQRTRAYTGLPQVTAPRDVLTARRNHRPCNAICTARSPRATLTAEAPPGAPRALGINGSTRWTDLQQQAPSKPMPRAAVASSKTSAPDGSGVPCPSWFPQRSGVRDGQKHLPDLYTPTTTSGYPGETDRHEDEKQRDGECGT